ncbi:unnamed protein product [Dicrocoelium dendriticum]|nr:unnamed protein product [Dicrocoelium dendriticum]
MKTMLSITVVTVALFFEYSTQVWSSASLSGGKNVTNATGEIRETQSSQSSLEASVQSESTKPTLGVNGQGTEQFIGAPLKSGASEQEAGYSLTFPTGRYKKWSNWSKCDPIECVKRRRRECVDGSWGHADVNRSGARRCPSRYYEETRDCKDKTTCVTYGMLDNCGVQTSNEDTALNPTEAQRTTSNSWPWLVRLITKDREGKEYYWCGGTLISQTLIVIAAHCFSDNGWAVAPGFPTTPENAIGTSLYAYLGNHRSSADHGTAKKYLVKMISIHTYHDTFKISKGYDIALLQLEKPADLNKEVNYACIATQPIEFEHGTKCYAVGWGQMPSSVKSNMEKYSVDASQDPFNPGDTDTDNVLKFKFKNSEPVEIQEVVLPIMSADKCFKYYPKHQKGSQFCAGWSLKDSCERDCRSGLYCMIPYTNKWLLAGVRNYGTETECKPGTGIYTLTQNREEWLRSMLKWWAS